MLAMPITSPCAARYRCLAMAREPMTAHPYLLIDTPILDCDMETVPVMVRQP